MVLFNHQEITTVVLTQADVSLILTVAIKYVAGVFYINRTDVIQNFYLHSPFTFTLNRQYLIIQVSFESSYS